MSQITDSADAVSPEKPEVLARTGETRRGGLDELLTGRPGSADQDGISIGPDQGDDQSAQLDSPTASVAIGPESVTNRGEPADQGKPGKAKKRRAPLSLVLWALVEAPLLPGPAWAALPPTGRRSGLKLALWLAGLTGLFFAVWGELASHQSATDHGAGRSTGLMIVALLLVIPLTQIHRGPLLTWRWQSLGLAGLATAMDPSAAWPWALTGLALCGGVWLLVAERHDTGLLVGVWTVTTALLILGGRNLHPLVLVVLSGAVAAVLLIGRLRGTRAATKGQLSATQEALDAEAAEAAVLTERTRIARELHDVVAHRMSLIAIQAEATSLRLPDLPAEAHQALGLIHDAAREALAETRGIVGLLRTPDGGQAERAPAPTASNIPDLVESARRSGLPVELTVIGEVRPVSAAVGLAAYRIVQESLANAARHAPGQAIIVEVDYQAANLRVLVRNRPDDGLEPTTTRVGFEGVRSGDLGETGKMDETETEPTELHKTEPSQTKSPLTGLGLTGPDSTEPDLIEPGLIKLDPSTSGVKTGLINGLVEPAKMIGVDR